MKILSIITMEKMIMLMVVALMVLGVPSVYARHLTDTEKEAGVASDAQGQPCTYGPAHDECLDQYIDRIRHSVFYQSGVKNGDYQSGYNHGVADGKINTTGDTIDRYYIHQPGQGFADHTTAFVDGYMKGWCSMNPGHSGIDVNDEPEPTIAAFDCDDGLISVVPNPSDGFF